MDKVEYTKSSEEMRDAWFKYKAQYNGIRRTLSLVDFAAGWNAARANCGCE